MKTDDIEDVYELSPIQQGMLFHSLSAPGSGVYVAQRGYRLDGYVDLALFTAAWERAIDRHTALRTSFHWDDLDKPLQVVHRRVAVPVKVVDWCGVPEEEQERRLNAYLQEDHRRGFDVSVAPLMRLALFRLAPDVVHCVWTHHMMQLDGWSLPVVIRDVFAFYDGACRGEEPVLTSSRPYREYIAWLQAQDLATAEAFWREELHDFAGLAGLPACRTAPAEATAACFLEEPFETSAQTLAALKTLGRQNRLTLNTFVQGAWALLLSRYGGAPDVVFGATSSGRPASLPGVESMVGSFINTLPLRVRIDPEASLLSWLHDVQRRSVAVSQYEYSPLVRVQQWSGLPRNPPLFETLLVFENYPFDADLEGRIRRIDPGLKSRPVQNVERTNYPVTVCLTSTPAGLGGRLIFDAAVVLAPLVRRMAGHLRNILEAMVQSPQSAVSSLPMLGEGERHQILIEWNGTPAPEPAVTCVQELFEAQAARTPDAEAVRACDQSLSYAELNRQANQLAWHLRTLGVGAEVRVGLCVSRGTLLPVSLLGILKAGGAYVPLDPADPPDRRAFVMANARVAVVVGEKGLWPEATRDVPVVCLGDDVPGLARYPTSNPPSVAHARTLAYVMYTSGSTGQPKGIFIEHGSAVSFLTWVREAFSAEDLSGVFASTSVSFDCSVFELFGPLSWGGRTIIADGPLHLTTLPDVAEVSLINATPSTLAALLKADAVPPSVRTVTLGGESSSEEIWRQLDERTSIQKVVHVYGPAEDTTYSTVYVRKAGDRGLMPIGRPLPGTSIYILDGNGDPVPVEVPGELYIAGPGLARGYSEQPDLTAERFLPDPFSRSFGMRCYRTGDRARYRADGNIEFLGRLDHQVKIRGVRIEPEEVEVVLARHPDVEEAAIVVSGEREARRLVAHVVLRPEREPSIGDLRAFLRRQVPEYLVPAAFHTVTALPRLANGKVNRRQLLASSGGPSDPTTVFVAPRTSVEETVAATWREVLALERVGRDDNFFDLGGHSLLTVPVYRRLKDAFGDRVALIDLFRYPTVAALAEHLGTARRLELLTDRGLARRTAMAGQISRGDKRRGARRMGATNE